MKSEIHSVWFGRAVESAAQILVDKKIQSLQLQIDELKKSKKSEGDKFDLGQIGARIYDENHHGKISNEANSNLRNYFVKRLKIDQQSEIDEWAMIGHRLALDASISALMEVFVKGYPKGTNKAKQVLDRYPVKRAMLVDSIKLRYKELASINLSDRDIIKYFLEHYKSHELYDWAKLKDMDVEDLRIDVVKGRNLRKKENIID